MGPGSHRCRLTLDNRGRTGIEHAPLDPPRIFRVSLCDRPVDSSDPLLYHKTTHRSAYDSRLASHPNADEVILANERGEITECCIGNIVAFLDGAAYTPPLESGLLPGTYRAELLARGEIFERVLRPEDLRRADSLYLINSLRRRVELELVD
jgi:para-aminobenzoate synthetase/4-amino-4-deoxychorismate lyase